MEKSETCFALKLRIALDAENWGPQILGAQFFATELCLSENPTGHCQLLSDLRLDLIMITWWSDHRFPKFCVLPWSHQCHNDHCDTVKKANLHETWAALETDSIVMAGYSAFPNIDFFLGPKFVYCRKEQKAKTQNHPQPSPRPPTKTSNPSTATVRKTARTTTAAAGRFWLCIFLNY